MGTVLFEPLEGHKKNRPLCAPKGAQKNRPRGELQLETFSYKKEKRCGRNGHTSFIYACVKMAQRGLSPLGSFYFRDDELVAFAVDVDNLY